MAVFGSVADRDLTALTWAVQVDTTSAPEMALFLLAFWNHLGLQKPAEQHRDLYGNIVRKHVQGDIHTFDVLVPICELARKVLGDVADFRKVQWGNMETMQSLASALPVKPPRRLITFQAGTRNDSWLEAQHVHYLEYPDQPPVALAWRIMEDFKGVFPDKVELVRRCTECNSPFVCSEYRTTQQFCSHRCADRAGTRRRRAGEGKSKEVLSY